MATVTKSQGKTSFVKEFIRENPQAKAGAVNEAWQAAGMKGTISHPVISGVRKQLGLIGNLSGKTRTAPNKPKTATTPGKTSFVNEFLNDHPEGNVRAVNEAWQAAGMKGTISKSVVDKTRALLGLTGNLSGKTTQKATRVKAPTGKPRGRKPKVTTSETRASSIEVEAPGRVSARTTILLAVETEIDRLIFTVMGLGDLPEIETALRDARRKVYRAIPT